MLIGSVLLAMVSAVPATASATPAPRIVGTMPGRLATLRARHVDRRVAPIREPAGWRATLAGPSAAIEVAYTGFSPEARAAFQLAVDIWSAHITSSQVIHVKASWTPLPTGVLGAAGPEAFYALSDGLVYPAALAEARCACEGSAPAEIHARFNSEFGHWYLGTDGNAPSETWDMVTAVLHELGHGLGFVSSFRISGSTGEWGYPIGAAVRPSRFDVRIWDRADGGTKLSDTVANPSPSAELKAQLTDGTVFFSGPQANSANGSARVRLYAPNPWAPGSSIIHLDETTFPGGTPDALMTPFLWNGEVLHDPGGIALAILRDIGWRTVPAGPPNVRISDVRKLEGDGGTTPFTLAVHLEWAADGDVVVAYATIPGTASPPSDYAATAGMITIPAGDTLRRIPVSVKADTRREPNERFRVKLVGSSRVDLQACKLEYSIVSPK